jgi:regulator of cell morphogenesis and NO signaling
MPTATQSIREIVTQYPSSAKVFHRFDIDLCLQADLSLQAACRELQLSVDQVLEKLAAAQLQEHGGVAFNSETLSLTCLIQHIVRVHHHCVRQELPRLAEMASTVAVKRGDRAPELANVAELIGKLSAEMLVHIEKEEQVLFPVIAQMDQQSIVAYPPTQACFPSIAQPIFMMKQEHKSADRIMVELIRRTNHFEPPSWACATHNALFSGLREFKAHLRQHFHLENDVLFPRAMQLQSELKGRN